MRVDKSALEFEWGKGNIGKNRKHKVDDKEAEEVFLDRGKKLFNDHLHSNGEERFRLVGKTKKERLLLVVFTIRKGKVRIISARNINKKEVYLYEKTT